jgi:DhnA family fructose-bisphosphate aldolase class Ia
VPAPAPLGPVRRLDRKLGSIAAGRYTPDDFVIADAKDADMAFGLRCAGPAAGAADGPVRYQTRGEYLAAMRALAAQGELDIVLTSASNGQRLAAEGTLRDETLAIRANDTTDIWNNRGGSYPAQPSRPFRTADLAAVAPFCDLVLYSMTFNNILDYDLATLEAYRRFRAEAAALGLRHILEVFNPNAAADLAPDQVGAFVNDSIVRALAGITAEHRPLFLKVVYNGAGALAELAGYDPSVVVGVLGGSAGTTRDTFELLHRAEKHGARVALFGRKIQQAESQLDLVGLMRPVLRGELSPADAVHAYHEALAGAGLTPRRPLEADLEVTDPVLRAE